MGCDAPVDLVYLRRGAGPLGVGAFPGVPLEDGAVAVDGSVRLADCVPANCVYLVGLLA